MNGQPEGVSSQFISSSAHMRQVSRFHLTRRHVRYLMVLPAVSVLFLITIFPFLYAINTSLRQVGSRNLRGEWPWVGLQNYSQVLNDHVVWDSIGRTVQFVALVVTAEMVLGFLLALFLVNEYRGTKILRVLLLTPMMVTPIVVGLMWKALFKLDGGMVNQILGGLGLAPAPWLTSQPLPFFSSLPAIGPYLVENLNANYGFLVLLFIDIWQWTPFVTLVLLSGLYTVPRDVLEAARVDGAGYWQIVLRVVMPMLRNAFAVVLLLRVMDALKVFDTVYALFGNAATYRLINVHIVTLTFRIRNYGEGAAMSIVVLIFILILSRLFMRAFLGQEKVLQ